MMCISRTPSPEMSPEERDARTVFCMQLAARIRPRDLEEFFSAVGKVRVICRYSLQWLFHLDVDGLNMDDGWIATYFVIVGICATHG